MGKKVEENTEKMDFTIDTEEVENVKAQSQAPTVTPEIKVDRVNVASRKRDTDNLINCLQNKIVTVKFIPQPGTISNPKHVLYGGMADRSVFTVTVPKLRSGTYKNVLTDDEKDYLE